MRNLSISSLTLSSLSQSPLFSYGESKHFIQFCAFSFSTNKFFSSFINSYGSTIKKDIQTSSFDNFIDTPIRVESASFYFQNIFSDRLMYEDFSDLVIKCCKFNDCSSSENGGAINSQLSVDLFNVVFINCKTEREGGAIYVLSSLICMYVSFINCSSSQKCGAFSNLSPHPDHIFINYTLFQKTEADLFGMFYCSQPGSLSYLHSNSTLSHASGCVGSFEAQNLALIMEYGILNSSSAVFHHGCLVLAHLSLCHMNHMIFFHPVHYSSDQGAGSAITASFLPSSSIIENSNFIQCFEGHAFVVAINDGPPLLFKQCCFEPNVFKDHYFFKENGLITFNNCHFINRNSSDNCPFSLGEIPLSENDQAGYNQNRNITNFSMNNDNEISLSCTVFSSIIITIFIKLIWDCFQFKIRQKKEKTMI